MDVFINLCMMVLVGVILYLLYIDRLLEQFAEEDEKLPIKAYVINLDKNKERWNVLREAYLENPISQIPLERFSAVVGKEVDLQPWLSPEAIRELQVTEALGYRTRHYQLTRGAVGCFLSHYTLAKKLIEDPQYTMYLILEDDAGISKDSYEEMKKVLRKAPKDWDYLFLGHHRLLGQPFEIPLFTKITGFWGMFGYLLHKRGAEKFVAAVESHKIDAQVDAYMSWLSQEGLMNMYATAKNIIFDNNTKNLSDIQIRLVEKVGINPFLYKGYLV